MTTPIRIGMILNIPFPQILNTIITASATKARNQLVDALLMAEDARLKPMQMITGPVTTGGRYLMTRFTPTIRIINDSTRYKRPATTTYGENTGVLSVQTIRRTSHIHSIQYIISYMNISLFQKTDIS